MADLFVNEPRVRETSTSSGTGSFSLDGVPSTPRGLRTFSSIAASNDKFYYLIIHRTADEWESGFGAKSPLLIDRDKVYRSSNGNEKVDFSSGTKDVFLFDIIWSEGFNVIEISDVSTLDAEVGDLYLINMIDASENLVVTFPLMPRIGDRFGYAVEFTNSSDGSGAPGFSAAPFWGIEPANNTTILGSSYSAITGPGGFGTGEYGLWIRGEKIIWTFDGNTWIPDWVSRITQTGHMRRFGTNQTLNTTGSTVIEVNESEGSTGVDVDLSNNRLRIRRRGRYSFLHRLRASPVGNTMADGDRLASVLFREAGGAPFTQPGAFVPLFASANNQAVDVMGQAEFDVDNAVSVQLAGHITSSPLDIDAVTSRASAPNLTAREL